MKPPFGGPEHVLAYLPAYTHRIAISNRRILAFDGERVTFSWRDYAGGNAQKAMTLDAVEFLRRFLLHVVPPCGRLYPCPLLRVPRQSRSRR